MVRRGPNLGDAALVRPYLDADVGRLARGSLDCLDNVPSLHLLGLFEEAIPEIQNPESLHVVITRRRRRRCALSLATNGGRFHFFLRGFVAT